jgi:hypothetical protein
LLYRVPPEQLDKTVLMKPANPTTTEPPKPE